MVAEREESHDSVALVYGLARTAYRDQFAQRDQQRTRCSALLAFAGILATLSITAARGAHGISSSSAASSLSSRPRGSSSPASFGSASRSRHASGSSKTSISSQAGATPELQILGNTVGVIRRNERTLQPADPLFGFAVLLLFLGTPFIGARVALLLR